MYCKIEHVTWRRYAWLVQRDQVELGYNFAAVCAIIGCLVMCTLPSLDAIERKATIMASSSSSAARPTAREREPLLVQ